MPELRADCERCFGLCCVVPAFSASADFAIDKPAGHPCRNLQPDSRCGIHATLRNEGFTGCTVYDCFGAGQQIAQVTFGGRDWRQSPQVARRMFASFPVMRQLHEQLWYLAEALRHVPQGPPAADLRAVHAETEQITGRDPDALLAWDAAAHWQRVDPLLLRTAELVRAETIVTLGSRPAGRGRKKLRRGADLVGADLRGVDLRAADLRGAYLIGADLRGTDLRGTDLIGTDLRAADVRDADLSGSLFLTRRQLDAARGNAGTALPPPLTRPAHWVA